MPVLRAFSAPLALAWTALVTAGLWLALSIVFALFGRSANDIVLLGLTQVGIYALVLAAFRYGSGTPLRELLALHRAPLLLCLAAAALGAALQVPASLLSNLVEHFFPTPPAVLAERMARITPSSTLNAISILVVVAGLGPCVEEFFFRGALFGALRKGYGALPTVWVISVCFALAHLDARLFLPLLVAALVLTQVREYTHSVWPGLALHAAFNATTLQFVFTGATPDGKAPDIPLYTAVTGCVLSVLLFRAVRRLALSAPASTRLSA
ncbi:MAG: type II CAAX endopeptidase family protein [Polyangiaceae bacterium]